MNLMGVWLEVITNKYFTGSDINSNQEKIYKSYGSLTGAENYLTQILPIYNPIRNYFNLFRNVLVCYTIVFENKCA